jgi:hypothetical protein
MKEAKHICVYYRRCSGAFNFLFKQEIIYFEEEEKREFKIYILTLPVYIV